MKERVFTGAIVDEVAKKGEIEVARLNREAIKQSASTLLSLVREGLVRDGAVRIHNFGTFKLKVIRAHKGVNPRTGAAIDIPDKPRIIFSPAKALRDRIEPVHPRPQPLPGADGFEVASDEIAAVNPAPESVDPATIVDIGGDEADPATTALPSERSSPSASMPVSEPASNTSAEQVPVLSTDAQIEPDASLFSGPDSESLSEFNDVASTDKFQEPEIDQQQIVSESSPLGDLPFDIAETQYDEPRAAQSFESDNSAELAPNVVAVSEFNLGEVEGAELRDHSWQPDIGREPEPESSKPSKPPKEAWVKIGIAAGIAVIAILMTFILQPDSSEIPPPAQAVAIPVEPAKVMPPAEVVTAGEQRAAESESVAQVAEVQPVVEARADPVEAAATAVPVEQVAAAAPYFMARDYALERGDSLWRLARHNYQYPVYWPHIYNANQASISNPHRLYRGDSIQLPTFYGEPDAPEQADRRSIAEGYLLMYRFMIADSDPDAFFALRAVAYFDAAVVEENREEIERTFKPNLKILFRNLKGIDMARLTRSGMPLF